MAKIRDWSEAQASEELVRRLFRARVYRKRFESAWRESESMLFSAMGQTVSDASVSFNSLAELDAGDADSGDSDIGINYAFRYVRFLHAQMSANPPAVLAKPTSTDLSDRRAAQAADQFVHHGRTQLKLQEKVDQWTLRTLCYGTGWGKLFWDPDLGEAVRVDKTTREITMQGLVRMQVKSTWDVWCDPDATSIDDLEWAWERHTMRLEEAVYRWPDKKDELEANRGRTENKAWEAERAHSAYDTQKQHGETVDIYEYHERGAPWNGMAGYHAFMLEGGEFLEPPGANPTPGNQIPLYPLTDVDVPDQVYGKSFIDYILRLQDILNRLDSTVLDAIQAHGVVRMVLPDGVEIQDEAINNSSWDWIRTTGPVGSAPHFVNPPTLMPDIYRFRQQLLDGMEALAGVNESMFGQVKRELSGFSLQTAINAGNLVRRRLFNKYEQAVRWLYTRYLENIRAKWSDPRKILVTGKEGALSVAYLSGADIENGYDLEVEYGSSLSLDPAMRREEIMQLLPLFEKAGVSMKTVLSMIRLNELSGLYDKLQLPERRQLEIFDEMEAAHAQGTDIYLPPEENENHAGMLITCQDYRMSATFKYLPPDVKLLVDRHIKERLQMQATKMAPPAPPAPAPGPLPGVGLPMGAPPAI